MPLQTAPVESCFPPLPRAVAALGTRRADGSGNFMAIAWHTPLSFDPPLYGVVVGSEKASHRFLSENPFFSVSFLPERAAGLLHALGNESGADIDKVGTLRLTLLAPQHGKAPMLAEAWLAYECRRVSDEPIGDQTLFVGEILAAHCDPRQWTGEGPTPEWRPLLQAHERLYSSLSALRGPFDSDS